MSCKFYSTCFILSWNVRGWVDQCPLALFYCWNANIMKSKYFAVIQNDLCKRLCLKMFPEISGVVHSIEVDNVIELDGNLLERNHKIYACLAFGLTPMRNNCISKSLFASSTNDDWDENFKNTLEPGDGNEDGPSYWSSIGQSDPSIPEALVYKLCSNICLVSEIHIQPYQG